MNYEKPSLAKCNDMNIQETILNMKITFSTITKIFDLLVLIRIFLSAQLSFQHIPASYIHALIINHNFCCKRLQKTNPANISIIKNMANINFNVMIP